MNSQAKLKCRAEDAVPRAAGSRIFRHVLCVHPYRRTSSSLTAYPPLGLEYIAAALRPHAERIDLRGTVFDVAWTPERREF